MSTVQYDKWMYVHCINGKASKGKTLFLQKEVKEINPESIYKTNACLIAKKCIFVTDKVAICLKALETFTPVTLP